MSIGKRLGPYRLDARLGSGAAGEVFRARDLKLGRDVALKILRPMAAADRDRQRRFAREARAILALNHPNIVHLYDVGEAEDIPYLAMELVEGRSLRQILLDGPLTGPDLLDIAVQLVEGLSKAHEAGVLHRDLKPENLMLSTDGFLKILDFGLVKLLDDPGAPDGTEPSVAPTMTQEGTVLGTAAYMSPEQAAGRPIDHRSDLFSVGAVLHELATGRPAFREDSMAETLVAVIRKQPRVLHEVVDDLPEGLSEIVARCLAKKPTERYASTRDLAKALRTTRDAARLSATLDSDAYRTAKLALTRSRWGRRFLVGGLLLAGIVVGTRLTRHAPADPASTTGPTAGRLRAVVSSTFADGQIRDPDLSADGRSLVYVDSRGGQSDLYLQRIAGGARVRLTDDATIEADPDLAPDGDAIAYTCRRPGSSSPGLCLVPALGGLVSVVLEGAAMPSWSPDGSRLACILQRSGRRIAVATVAPDGSDLEVLFETDAARPFLYHPAWSPEGDTIAVRRSAGGVSGEIWLVALDGRPARPVGPQPSGVFSHDPAWAADGASIIVASNRSGATNLWRLPLADGAAPERLTFGAGPDELATVGGDKIAFLNTIWRYSLRRHDLSDGRTEDLASHDAYLWAPIFSADGHEVIYSRAEVDGQWHVWSVDASGGEPRQRTRGERGEVYPRRAGDGALLLTTWSQPRVLVQWQSGGALTELDTGGPAAWGDVSPDGDVVFVRRYADEERMFVLERESGEVRALLERPGTVPRWSPDGRWIAFSPDRTVLGGVYLADVGGTEVRQLTDRGGWPVWWPDGSRVGFLAARSDGNQEVRVVGLEGGPTEALSGLKFHGTNHPFDIDDTGRWLVTTDSQPVTSRILLLEPDTADPENP